MATALDLIKSSMRKAGILTKTESPSGDESNDALQTMNALLESWATESLTVPYRTLENFTLSAGQANYTIGTSGDFNTMRPVAIISAYVKNGTTDSPPLTLISDDVYAGIASKSVPGIPEYLNYTNAHPLGIIRLYPVPSETCTLAILSEKQLGAFTLNQTVDLPVGWERALVYGLAVELAPEYGQSVSQEVAVIAMDSLSKIKRAVARNRPLDAQPLAGGGSNIFLGFAR